MGATCNLVPLIKNKEGEMVESKLFTDLLLSGMKRNEAIRMYNLIYTSAFKSKNGDWEYFPSKYRGELDENGQPTLATLNASLSSSYKLRTQEDTLEDSARKMEGLTKTFADAGIDVNVKFDNSLGENANVKGTGDRSATITLNPNKVFKDTIPHEYGHVYIDILGDDPIIQQGVDQLRDSKLADEVRETYPDLSGRALDKEILTTAIGVEAADLFDNPEAVKRWNFWLSRVFRAIGEKLGIQPNVAKKLAMDMVRGKLREGKGKISRDIQQQRATLEDVEQHIAEKGYELSPDETHYTDVNKDFEFGRGTEVLHKMYSNDNPKGEPNLSYEEHAAREEYRKAKKQFAEDISVDGKTMTYKELVEYKRMKQNTDWRIRGKIVHAIIQNIIKPSEKIAKDLAGYYAGKKGESFAIDEEEYSWVEEKIGEIFEAVGINTYQKGIKPKDKDKVLSEVTIASKLMGIATTIDTLVQDAKGLFSIFDWKTGNLLSDATYANFMKYGRNQIEPILDTKLNKAKLEVVLRAMIFKESMKDKTVQYKDLAIVGISKNNPTQVHEINIEPYLGLIESYYADAANEKLDVYAQLKAQGLFDPTQYIGNNDELVDDRTKNMTVAEKKVFWANELREHTNYIKDLKENKKKSYAEIGAAEAKRLQLVDQVAKVNAELGEDPTTDDISDMGWIKRKIGNMNSIKNPRIKSFIKILTNRQKSGRDRIREIHEHLDELGKKVYTEYFDKHGMKDLLKKATLGGLNALKYQEVFEFMNEYKKDDTHDGYYTRVITQAQVDSGKYSQAQYEYNKYIRETMQKEYKQAVGKISHYRGKHAVTIAEAQGLPAELDPDFMPRYAMTGEEAIERNGRMSKEYKDYFINSVLSDFTANQYKPNDKQKGGLPLKFMGSSNIIKSQNHTLSSEISFKNFISNVIMKDELDDMQSLGDGIVELLKTKTDNEGNEFKNTIEFLQDQILLHVQDTKRNPKWTSRHITFTYEGEKKTVSIDKVLRGIKSWVSWSAMWVKPIPAMFNAGLIVVMNSNKAIVGSIAKRLPGANPEDYDFSIRHLARAQINYADFLFHAMMGQKEKSKLWQLAKHLDYLPDNYDYAIRKSELQFKKNSLLDRSNLYFFHSIGEEYAALTLLAAQAHHYKMGSMSMWESYDFKDGKFQYVGDRNMKLANGETLTALSAEEIRKFKRVSSLVHGGYRQDERTSLDLTAMGQLLNQFKKYLPNVLESMGQSKYNDDSLGRYELRQNEAGEDVYTWIARINEGRARVLVKWLGATLRLQNDPNYKWSTMPQEQRQRIVELMVAGTFLAGMNVANAVLHGDDDDDDDKMTDWEKMIQRKLLRLADDQSQGIAFWDVLNSVQSQASALPKLYKTSLAMKDILIEGLLKGKRTQKGDIPGWNYLLGQAVPLASSWKDVSRYIDTDLDETTSAH